MTKTSQIIEKLGQRVRQGEWMESLPPLTSLSEQFGVSPGTISLAIRSLEKEGLVRVLPRQGIFVTDLVTQSNHAPSAPTVGIRGSYVSKASEKISIYAQAILTQILQVASNRHGSVLMLPAATTSSAPITRASCEHQGIKGMIFLGGESEAEALSLRQEGFPVIQGNKPVGATGLNYVDYNHAATLREIVHRFAEAGHQRIAVLFPRVTTPHRFDSLKSDFIDALCEKDIYYNPKPYWRFVQAHPKDLTQAETIEHAIHELLQLAEPPTALFCESSVIAEQAAQILKRNGLSIPHDISLACSAYNSEADVLFSGFVTPHHQLANDLVEGLYAIIQNPFHIVQKQVPLQFIDKGTVSTVSGNR